MQYLKRSASAALLAVALITTVGCATSLPKESAGEYLDDTVITTKVKASIIDQPTLKTLEIKVETFKGTVYLRGLVASQSVIDKAGEVARSISGVKEVKNELRLK